MTLFSVSKSVRGEVKKALTLLLAVSMNISAVGSILFLAPTVASAATLFSDGFEGSSPFSAWTSVDSKWQSSNDERTGSTGIKSVRV